MNSPNDVIDWNEAMQQCGDDEEFLRELLADLRTETEAQLSSIDTTIQVRNNLQDIMVIIAIKGNAVRAH